MPDDKTAERGPALEDLLDDAMAQVDNDVDWEAEIEDAPWAKSDEDLMKEAMEESMSSKGHRSGPLQRGDQVTGTIVHVSRGDVFVDVGGKSEGLLDATEVQDEDGKLTVKVGETLTLFVSQTSGETVRLSYKMAVEARDREAVRLAYAEQAPLEGRITAQRKGGFDVKFKSGQRAFLPLSQLELRRVEDEEFESYVGRTFEFLITKYQSDGDDLVVSRSRLLKEAQAEQRAELRGTLEEGQIRNGTVSRIVDFGAFVDLGGLDGLVHVSEIEWGRTESPQHRLKVGQSVDVKVLRIDREKGTVALSIKRAIGDPWDKVGTEFTEGSVYQGTVARLEAFGAFVELEPGLEGLVHVSEISWERIRHPEVVLQVGERVSVKLIRVEMDKHRLGLSIKALGGDPWTDVAPAWMRGQLLAGTVDRVAPFGVFIQLAPGVSGLIPNSDLGMDQSQAHTAFQPGKEVTVELADVDLERRRIRLIPSDEKAQGERDAVDQYRKVEQDAKKGLGTLADLLGGLKLDD